jgi:Flp pilus assembly pilin Flp
LEYALLAGAIGLALSSVIGAIGGEIQGTLESFTALLRASEP